MDFSVFRDVKNEIKWAYQRVFRGWDDRVIWSIDYHLAANIPLWLEELKKDQSCPTSIAPEGVDVSSFAEEDWDTRKEEWTRIIDSMIDGFRAAEDIINKTLPSWDIFYDEYEKRYGCWDMKDHEKDQKLMEELGTWDGIKKEEEALMLRFDAGMDLFKKYFFNLWT